MLEAKSMYLGGEIVMASECDFESSTKLGLVCPFCSSALFLRCGSIRETTLRNGKQAVQIVRPAFAHYKAGMDDECEKRSYTKEGKEKIENARIEARGQRLRLYNAYLWEMIRTDRNIKWSALSRIYKVIPRQQVESLSVLIRKEWRDSLDSVYTYIDDAIGVLSSGKRFEAHAWRHISASVLEKEAKIQQDYFLGTDCRLHKTICCEIADFLATNSAGFVFANIVRAAIYLAILAETDPQRYRPRDFIPTIGGIIGGCHWVKIIAKYMGERNEINA